MDNKKTSVPHEAQIEGLADNTRRYFIKQCGIGLASLAISGFEGDAFGAERGVKRDMRAPTAVLPPHHIPKAKHVIYLHMAGAPSQLELFDYKPDLVKYDGKECPEHYLEGKSFAFITGVPKMLGPVYPFKQHGRSGAWLSDRLVHLSKHVDDIAFIKSMHTDEINHAPAAFLLHTGFARAGRPSMGSWMVYGLGSENQNLPGYIVLESGGNSSTDKSMWGSGFLPSVYQGVQCRSNGEPVLFSKNPAGISREVRQSSIKYLDKLNKHKYESVNDPETLTRIAQYEMAFRMQMSVPGAMDINDEPDYIHQQYGTQPGKRSFANNCLLARKLVEKGVRFVQLFHGGWDSHGVSDQEALNPGSGFAKNCQQVDQPIAALLEDLKVRGLLEDTLVIWGAEFGRTPMQENRGGVVNKFLGRDHHPTSYTCWMTGAGVKKGITYGATDDIGYEVAKDPVHVHDLQATIMHLLGFDHERLTYRFQGRDFRLTDVHGHVVKDLLA